MADGKRILVTFGRTDPLRLTEATLRLLGDSETQVSVVIPSCFSEERKHSLSQAFDFIPGPSQSDMIRLLAMYDMVYTGHGATLLEATAAGCEVMVLHDLTEFNTFVGGKPAFISAWTGLHLDHSGKPVRWWEPGIMSAMAAEIRGRREGGR